jgi:hypothetical protein
MVKSIIFIIVYFVLYCIGLDITLTEPKANYGVATYKNLALFAGGFDGMGVANSVIVFDGLSLSSYPSNPLQQARVYCVGTTFQNFGIFAGGSLDGTVNNCSNAVDIYDFSETPVQRVATNHTLSQARTFLAAASVGDLAIFAGGTNGNFLDTVDIYNSATATWSTAKLTQARAYLSATSVGTRAIFAGGRTSTGFSNVVDIFDSATAQWTSTTLTSPRQQVTQKLLVTHC